MSINIWLTRAPERQPEKAFVERGGPDTDKMPVKYTKKGSYLRASYSRAKAIWMEAPWRRKSSFDLSFQPQQIIEESQGRKSSRNSTETQLASSLPGLMLRSAHLPRDGVHIVLRPSVSRQPLTDITTDKGGLGSPLVETQMTRD